MQTHPLPRTDSSQAGFLCGDNPRDKRSRSWRNHKISKGAVSSQIPTPMITTDVRRSGKNPNMMGGGSF